MSTNENEQVERVARAICEALDDVSLTDTSLERTARAAITAMGGAK